MKQGFYTYAPLSLMLLKRSGGHLIFMEGKQIEKSQYLEIELPSLSAGDYVVVYKAEMRSGMNLHRKVVTHIYSQQELPIRRIKST